MRGQLLTLDTCWRTRPTHRLPGRPPKPHRLRPVLEELLGGVVQKSYTIGHDVFAEAIAANQLRHLLKDGHNSTRQLVDALGNILTHDGTPSGTLQIFAYDAYGNPIGFTPAIALTTLLYNTEQLDKLTGLQYLRARYYNPHNGTFNCLDPQSFHKYLYTHAEPVNMTDPSGMNAGVFGGFRAFLRGARYYDLTFVLPTGFTMAAGLRYLNLAGALALVYLNRVAISEFALDMYILLKTNTAVAGRAIAKAISSARAAGRKVAKNIKIFPIIKSMGPHIYAHNVKSLNAKPTWFVLTYMASRVRTAANRQAAIRGKAFLYNRAKGLNSLDEFPYASTGQGGARAKVAAVPLQENRAQGGALGGFYRWQLKGKPGGFLVVPIPI